MVVEAPPWPRCRLGNRRGSDPLFEVAVRRGAQCVGRAGRGRRRGLAQASRGAAGCYSQALPDGARSGCEPQPRSPSLVRASSGGTHLPLPPALVHRQPV